MGSGEKFSPINAACIANIDPGLVGQSVIHYEDMCRALDDSLVAKEIL